MKLNESKMDDMQRVTVACDCVQFYNGIETNILD